MDNFKSPLLYYTDYECPYYHDGRITTLEICYTNGYFSGQYHLLLSRGYRRYKDFFYRNICKKCSDCISLRLEVSQFRLSKSQKRTMKINQDIVVNIGNPKDNLRIKETLFKKYKENKHPDDESHNYQEMVFNLLNGYPYILEIDFYLKNLLIGVSIIDTAQDGLSANYFFYDTDYLTRRLGIFSALIEIGIARELGKKFYYPGFFIENISKMSYKKYFRPNQILVDDKWLVFME